MFMSVFKQININVLLLSATLFYLPMVSHADMDNLRGQRYCEIFLAKKLPDFDVYNTLGLNDCPDNQWNTITVELIKHETGASYVHLNGPRYWTIDGLTNSKLVNQKEKILGGIAMRKAAILHLTLWDVLNRSSFYREHHVTRETTWVYKSGHPVYELINPAGQVFVMQSFSTQKYPQTEASLSNLGDKLTLPQGWSFLTGTLKKDTYLKAIDNNAVVIQDDFLNTYQKATLDFL